jgi:hypothetical protein
LTFRYNALKNKSKWEFINGSIVKAHQHNAGAASKKDQAIGKSIAGNTTKIRMAVESQ